MSGADVVEPMLGLYPERVVITDYKSSDVRDPAKARQRAKDSLQLSIYAMGYEAMTGRLPGRGRAPLPRDRAWSAWRRWTAGGSTRRARRSGRWRPGSGRGTSRRSRTTCPAPGAPFREICPSSAVR